MLTVRSRQERPRAFFSRRVMELRGVKCTAASLHLILDDVPQLWVSAASVSAVLGFSQPRKLLKHYVGKPGHNKHRSNFPVHVLDSRDAEDVVFVKLATIHAVPARALRREKLELLEQLRSELVIRGFCGWRDMRKQVPPAMERTSRSSHGSVRAPSRRASAIGGHVAAPVGADAAAPLRADGAGAPAFADLADLVAAAAAAVPAAAAAAAAPAAAAAAAIVAGGTVADDGNHACALGEFQWAEHDVATFASPGGANASPFVPPRDRRSGRLSFPPRLRRVSAPFSPKTPEQRVREDVEEENDERGAVDVDACYEDDVDLDPVSESAYLHGVELDASELLLLRGVIAAERPDKRIEALSVHPVLVCKMHSVRTTSQLRVAAERDGHLLRTVTTRSKELLLGAKGSTDALLFALQHHRMQHRVNVRYEYCGIDHRVWTFKCSTLSKMELKTLVTKLMLEDLAATLPAELDTAACLAAAQGHSWVQGVFDPALQGGPRVTSMAQPDEEPFAPDACVASVNVLMGLLSHIPCSVCRGVGGVTLVERKLMGVETLIHYKCGGCQRDFTFRPFEGKAGVLNKMSYVACESSGSLEMVNRYLSVLMGAHVVTSSNGREFASVLAPIIVRMADGMMQLQWAYMAVRNKIGPLAFDAAYQRSQRHANHAHNAFESIVDILTKQVVGVVYYYKDAAREQRTGPTLSTPSPFADRGAPPLVTDYKGGAIDAMLMDQSMQWVLQCIVVAKHGASDEPIEWDAALERAIDALDAVVVDALKAAPGIVALRGHNRVKLYLDWWHRRKAFKKAIRKAAGYNKANVRAKGKDDDPLAQVDRALDDVFSDSLYACETFAVFEPKAVSSALAWGISVDELDADNREVWDKLMVKAKTIMGQTRLRMDTTTNELVHNHKNHYVPKGVKCTEERFQMRVWMSVMSWNMVPEWRTRAKNEFLASF